MCVFTSRKPVYQTENEHIFHAIRFFFFLYLKPECMAFCPSFRLYSVQRKGTVFSGYSGMGKSTHTALWHDLIERLIFNGDLNLIGTKDGIIRSTAYHGAALRYLYNKNLPSWGHHPSP